MTTRAASSETKSAQVAKLLRRPNGATLEAITKSTGWKPHSVRAFLSRRRKKGVEIVREKRKSGETAYRIAKSKS